MSDRLLSTLWRTNRVVPLVLTGLLALSLAAYGWIALVVSPEVSDLERRYIEQQAMKREADQNHGRALSPRQIYRQSREDLATFRKAIPPKSDFPQMVKEIFSLAEGSGLVIDQITYSPKELAGKEILNYGLNFSVSGDYGQIKKFVFSLEQSPRIIAIEEISLSEGKNEKGIGVTLRIRLSTYFDSEVS